MASLELECKIVQKLAVQSGRSARGDWSKQEIVVEYQDGNYPNKVCMSVWGPDKVRDLEGFNVGENVKVSLNLSSREYAGKWYTDVRIWRMEHTGGTAPQQTIAPKPTAVPPMSAPLPSADDYSSPDSEDDLPF